ncbi:MAG: glycosyltransferase family 2 protein [Bacteroidota bacterium]
MTKVSIITASHNSAQTIADTLQSVAAQKEVSVEHLIIDGASKDETQKIVEQYAFAKWHSEPDRGIYDAMNNGIQKASGEIVGILNSDDFYADDQVLSDVLKQFEDPSINAVYGDLDYVDHRDINKITRRWRSGQFHPNAFKMGWMPPHPTFFVRRQIYEQYGTFNLSFQTAADYELMLRFLHKHKIQVAYIPRVLVKMRTGGLSNSSFQHRLRANQEDRRAWAINDLKVPFYTTWLKPLRKLGQWL